jgi:hypothetical protein
MAKTREEIERLVVALRNEAYWDKGEVSPIPACIEAADTIKVLATERDALSEKLKLVDAHSGGTLDQFVALVKDAGRYRWLRSAGQADFPATEIGQDWWSGVLGDTIDDDFDAAIDAALAAQEKP